MDTHYTDMLAKTLAIPRQRITRQRLRAWLIASLPALGQLATLVAVAGALLMPATVDGRQLPAAPLDSDLMRSHWPTALLIKATVAKQHRLPLWNPYYAGGQPLAGDPLAALFYPPTQLVNILSLRDYYMILLLGHLVFAGVGMLLLARRMLGLSRLSALVAAVSFMATPRLLSHLGAGHVTIVQTVAWFPWLVLACWATARNPRRWGALLALAVAMTLLAGHPQMAYYGLLMTGTVAIWLLLRQWRQAGWRTGWRSLVAPVVGLGAAAGLGVVLAGALLVPLLEFTARSTRQLTVSSTDSYRLRDFVLALLGWEHPSAILWEGMLYPGLVVLILAGIAIVVRWRKSLPLVLGVVLVASLAMGNASLVYVLVARVLPEFDLFRGLARIWFVALVPIALLAGIGADWVVRLARRVAPRAAVACGVLLVVLVAITLWRTDFEYARVNTVTQETTPNSLALQVARLAGTGRVYGVQRNIAQLYAVELHLPLADGWDPLLIQSYVTYMQRAGGYTYQGYQLTIPPSPAYNNTQPDARLLGLTHVSVVVSRDLLTDPRLVLAGSADGTLIYRNTADAGPGYLVAPGADGNPPALDHAQPRSAGVRAIALAPEQEVFSVTTAAPAYFVIPMPAFPGWSATLDGRPVPTKLFVATLPAMLVGPGTHRVTYTYAPASVRLGVLLSALGLLVALTWLVLGSEWLRARFWHWRAVRAYSPASRRGARR